TPTIKETPYIIKTISENKFFGTAGIWRRDTKVQVSIPARTIADLLNDPAIGGGIRHVAEIVERFFTGEHRDETGLLEAVARLNNRTIYKRLGYIIEIFTLDAPEALRLCHERLSAGYSTLDPTVEAQGSLMRRWMLRINVRLKSEEPTP
ncbi:MAG: hypothetical protein HYZ89_07190, partial [Candidatus Omnitrophica bacterium]|nr:hypothetical protein [Candidatus Omnitrophota bacterium]